VATDLCDWAGVGAVSWVSAVARAVGKSPQEESLRAVWDVMTEVSIGTLSAGAGLLTYWPPGDPLPGLQCLTCS
jgi:hypothetical protein